jgi:hypothetical protein
MEDAVHVYSENDEAALSSTDKEPALATQKV